jgi:hypothetical protein
VGVVADLALPAIFSRLRHPGIAQTEPVRLGGSAFRGLLNCRWHGIDKWREQ